MNLRLYHNLLFRTDYIGFIIMINIFPLLLLITIIVVSSVFFIRFGFSSSSTPFIAPHHRKYIRILENHPTPPREASDSHRLFDGNHHHQNRKKQQHQRKEGDDERENLIAKMPLSWSNLLRLRSRKIHEYRKMGLGDKEKFHEIISPPSTSSSAPPHSINSHHFHAAKHYIGNAASELVVTPDSIESFLNTPQLIDTLLEKKVLMENSMYENVFLMLNTSSSSSSSTSTATNSNINNNYQNVVVITTPSPSGSDPNMNIYNSYASPSGSASLCQQDEALRIDFTHDLDGDGKLYGNLWGSGFMTVEAGDIYEYEIMWLTEHCNCGAEIEIGNDWRLRDHGPLDSRGYSPHSEKNQNMSSIAYKRWYKRRWNIGNFTAGGQIERYIFSAYQPPGSKGSALFRNIRIMHFDESTGKEFVKKVIWAGGESSSPTLQNNFFKGSFHTSCQSLDNMIDIQRSKWSNLPLRRGETSRLSFEVSLMSNYGGDGGHLEEETLENTNNDDDSMEHFQNCPSSYCDDSHLLFTCCQAETNPITKQCLLKEEKSASSSTAVTEGIHFFRNLAQIELNARTKFRPEQVVVESSSSSSSSSENQKNNSSSPSNLKSTAFLQNWRKLYNEDEFSLTEVSSTIVLNWTARLRHLQFPDVTLWDLNNNDDDENNNNNVLTSSSSNFSFGSDDCGGNLNDNLNSIVKNRDRELYFLEASKERVASEISSLQTSKNEEEKKSLEWKADWAAKSDELHFLKMQSDLSQIDWDMHFLEALYRQLVVTTPSSSNKYNKNKHFPILESIDFDVPGDIKAMPFLKNILSKKPKNSGGENSENNNVQRKFGKAMLEVTISFARLKILVTKRKGASKNRKEEEEQGFEDLHVKEVKVSSTQLFENDFSM